MPASYAVTDPAVHLYRLFWLRNIAISGQALTIVVAWQFLGVALPLAPLFTILGIAGLANVVTRIQVRRVRRPGDLELFGHILLDTAALSGLMFCTGGSTNPFVAFYLIPITIAAVMLPRHYSWLVAAICIVCYSAQMIFYLPLPIAHDSHATGMSLHIFGMWLTFLLSACLIAYFVVGIRERDQLLAKSREAVLLDERILALGAMAAGAAHELGTPLATMAVLAQEMQEQYASEPSLIEDLALLRRQVDSCKSTISQLLSAAGQGRLEGCRALPLTAFADAVIEKWQLMRPFAHFRRMADVAGAGPLIAVDETLKQALINILNNAADASPQWVALASHWQGEAAYIDIFDKGRGLQGQVAQQASQAFFTTKQPGQGTGLGLFLARAAIERLGGKLQFINQPNGLMTRITLPVVGAPAGRQGAA